MKANRAARRREDGAQLLLLSGIVLVLAFIVTALTLAQLADLEKQAAEEQETRLLVDYRFVREKVGTTLYDAVSPTTRNETFNETFTTMALTFKALMQEKGYDLLIHKADKAESLGSDEWNVTQAGHPVRDDDATPPAYADNDVGYSDAPNGYPDNRTVNYHFRSHNNSIVLEEGHVADPNDMRMWDRNNDGIIWTKPCIRNNNGCIQAAIVYIYLADSTTTIEEYVVYGFNT